MITYKGTKKNMETLMEMPDEPEEEFTPRSIPLDFIEVARVLWVPARFTGVDRTPFESDND